MNENRRRHDQRRWDELESDVSETQIIFRYLHLMQVEFITLSVISSVKTLLK